MLVPTFSIGIRAHLLLLLSGWYTTTQAQSNPSEKIRQIENHLLPAIVVEGEEVEPLNISDRMKQLRIPGLSIAVIKDGKIEWVKGYGFASQEEQRPVNENTMFQAASISKPLTALATLHWVEKGTFSLDTHINAYLKNWQVPDTKHTTTEKATLRQIMSHTAGLTVHGFRGYAANEEIPSIIQILKGEKPANSPAVLPDTVPGRIFRYSGGGYTVLQKALVDQLKKPFPTLMHETVLSKLGMHHSSYEQPLAERFRALAATGYQINGKALKGRYNTYPEMAAAGLWTSPSDLARYIIDVQQSLKGKSNRLISKAMTELMLTKNLDLYGLGPMMQNEGDSLLFIHGGSNNGFRSLYVAQAYHGNGVVIMTNSDNGFTIIYDLMRSISKVYGWNFYRPMPVKKFTLSPEQIGGIVGTYSIPDYSFEVVQTSGKLYLKPHWDKPSMEMIPESREVFIDRDGQHRLELLYDEAHTVTSARVFGDAFKKVK
ncbi:serine hydrolase domain-containing protein [Larkinella punicea]|uniref:Class A beta-lactamase-related serine hydrolase n=1 Tax=Larkinella punicea TaxID=2315727 RepID=A0A368JJB5_9BACT|nr:serine hydrolase domain-containing protein [Larkinella punicea]RCR67156.1 class A beta-lactamase-related serine hydrolase [Larkinella punicea]